MKKIIFLLSVFTISCEEDVTEQLNSAPVISSIFIDTDGKFAGDDISINAIVEDQDNDIVSYEWTVSTGSFDIISDTNIVWNSPLSEGVYNVSLKVTDSKNNTDVLSEEVSIDLSINTFQNLIDATYFRLFSESETVVINGYIYYYSAESIGTNGTAYRLKKIDQEGNVIWTNTYDEFPDSPRRISGMYKTPDNKLILKVGDGIIKVGTEGEVLWNFNDQNLRRFVEMENGNYFMLGSTYTTEWIPSYTILSPDGVLVKQGIIEAGYDIRSTYDIAIGPEPNTFFVLALVNNPETPITNNLEILRINSSGELLEAFDFRYAPGIKGRLFREDDGSYSAFYSPEIDFSNQINRIHITSTGSLIDKNTYTFENYNYAIDVERLAQGGYLIAGAFGTRFTNARSLFFRINQSGAIEWQKEYGMNTDVMDFASSILELEDGKIVVTGSVWLGSPNSVSSYIHKYNSDGSLE